MKFLQIKNTPDGKPRALVIGVDFDFTDGQYLYTYHNFAGDRVKNVNFTSIGIDHFLSKLCCLSECYQSRPLIEIDSFCEFDIVETTIKAVFANGDDAVITHLVKVANIEYQIYKIKVDKIKKSKTITINHGSIFLPENKVKYPLVYEEAMEIIK